jgi:hypothetical protein
MRQLPKRTLQKMLQRSRQRKQFQKKQLTIPQQKLKQRLQQKLKQKLQQKQQEQTTRDAHYTRQNVLTVETTVKFRSSQALTNQYTAGIATRNTDHQGAALAAVAVAVVEEEAVAAVSAADQGRCTMQLVQLVEKHARFRSSLQATDQFTVETAIRNSSVKQKL